MILWIRKLWSYFKDSDNRGRIVLLFTTLFAIGGWISIPDTPVECDPFKEGFFSDNQDIGESILPRIEEAYSEVRGKGFEETKRIHREKWSKIGKCTSALIENQIYIPEHRANIAAFSASYFRSLNLDQERIGRYSITAYEADPSNPYAILAYGNHQSQQYALKEDIQKLPFKAALGISGVATSILFDYAKRSIEARPTPEGYEVYAESASRLHDISYIRCDFNGLHSSQNWVREIYKEAIEAGIPAVSPVSWEARLELQPSKMRSIDELKKERL